MAVTSRPGEAARKARLRFQVKGSVLRGRIAALEEMHGLERITPHLEADTRTLLAHPPLASSWIDGARLVEIDDVVFDVLGQEALESVSLASVRQSVGPLLRNVTEGTLRLFGASPATLLARMDTLSASTVRGVTFVWTPSGPNRGSILVTYADCTDVPISAFIATRAGFVNVFEMCGGTGTVAAPVRGEERAHNSARFDCSW